MNGKLFIVVNVDRFFLSHRKEIALKAKQDGWDVTIVTADTGMLKEITSLGLKAINLPMSRSGMNLIQELRTLFFLIKLYRREKPNIVHHVGMKTILWGTLAAKYVNIWGVVNAISGLGGFFADDARDNILVKMVIKILKISHNRKNLLCIFQNDEDKALYIRNNIIRESQARYIKGSGVNLDEYSYSPEPSSGKIIVVLTARMIVEKGVFILIDAANLLRERYDNKIEFQLIGGIDDHPGAITKDQLEIACDNKYIKWLGFRTDVKDLLRKCHIVAFPSYYMEGLPKSLIEACAIGRPIITCNSVGCKDAVIDGYNGFLIPIKDSYSLAQKIESLLNNPELRHQMGINGRRYAEKWFSIDLVIKQHLAIYTELMTLCKR